jgi:hypothetical protein
MTEIDYEARLNVIEFVTSLASPLIFEKIKSFNPHFKHDAFFIRYQDDAVAQVEKYISESVDYAITQLGGREGIKEKVKEKFPQYEGSVPFSAMIPGMIGGVRDNFNDKTKVPMETYQKAQEVLYNFQEEKGTYLTFEEFEGRLIETPKLIFRPGTRKEDILGKLEKMSLVSTDKKADRIFIKTP